MIFSPELAEKVLSGEKTVTRRPAKPKVMGAVFGGGDLIPKFTADGACRYRPGKDYAVQPGRGKKAIGRILILDVRLEPVGNIQGDWQEARCEGFEDPSFFIAYWRKLYGSYNPDQLVHRIQFQLLREGE